MKQIAKYCFIIQTSPNILPEKQEQHNSVKANTPTPFIKRTKKILEIIEP